MWIFKKNFKFDSFLRLNIKLVLIDGSSWLLLLVLLCLFRLIKRYPLVKHMIDKQELPEIDYLYLDMNGIIYKCVKVI